MSKNPYTILLVNKDKLELLENKNPREAQRYLRDALRVRRRWLYGNMKEAMKDLENNQSEVRINEIESFESLKGIIKEDIERIIAYDTISTKEKREKYDSRKKINPNIKIEFLKVDPIELEVERILKEVSPEENYVDINGRRVDAYRMINVLKKETESACSLEESMALDKQILERYNILKRYAEQVVESSIINGGNFGEVNRSDEIEKSLRLLKLKWAFDKIKDRESRIKYNSDREYALKKEQERRLEKKSRRKLEYKEVTDSTKYAIKWDSEEFYLKPLSNREEEVEALKQGRKVISLSGKIGVQESYGLSSVIEEYTVESLDEKGINVAKVLTDDFSIIKMAKRREEDVVIDRGYSNYTLGRVLSDESIEGCVKHRFGYIGRTVREKNGEYVQYFDEDVMHVAKEFKEQIRGIGE